VFCRILFKKNFVYKVLDFLMHIYKEFKAIILTAYLFTYLAAKKILKAMCISLEWKELSW